jgi:hypothetical protein
MRCLIPGNRYDRQLAGCGLLIESQGFLVSHSILKKNISQGKIHQKVYRDTTFGGCGSFSSKDILPVKRKE